MLKSTASSHERCGNSADEHHCQQLADGCIATGSASLMFCTILNIPHALVETADAHAAVASMPVVVLAAGCCSRRLRRWTGSRSAC
jgi:hypothetical protein